LPPEFARAERFDAVFFVDLPTKEEREVIWRLYLDRFEFDHDAPRPADDGWTGAEIRSCCRLARLLDVPLVQAAQQVVPVAVTAREQIERLRRWASDRCLAANRPGLFTSTNSDASTPRRKLPKGDPGLN
jgi:SpoVK/Ycf46/Vps4 family AAA+-type ATPase